MPEEPVSKVLGQQLGPLPVAGWAAALIGGVGIAWYMARKNKAATPAPVSTASPQGAGFAGVGPGNIGLGAVQLLPNGAASSYGTLPASSPATKSYTSNSDWITGVSRDLIARGYDPVLVQRALTDYINGANLSSAELQVVELALGLDGPPPSAPPVSTPAAPGWVPPVGEQQSGAGYWYVGDKSTQPIADAGGDRYQWISSLEQASALEKAGQPIFFQPQPGFFVEWHGGGPQGAPLYAKLPKIPAGV